MSWTCSGPLILAQTTYGLLWCWMYADCKADPDQFLTQLIQDVILNIWSGCIKMFILNMHIKIGEVFTQNYPVSETW